MKTGTYTIEKLYHVKCSTCLSYFTLSDVDIENWNPYVFLSCPNCGEKLQPEQMPAYGPGGEINEGC